MDARLGMTATTFDPLSDFIQEEDCNTLLLYLPGFTKEQLKVQLTRSKVLKISGSRPIGDNKLSSFQKDFPVSENVDTNKITAKFEDGILYVRQPKLIVPADKDEQKAPPLLPHKPAERPPNTDQQHQSSAAQGRSDMQGTSPGSAPAPAPKTTPNAADTKHTSGTDYAEKAKEKKEEKPTKKAEKTSESESGKKHKTKSDVDHDQKVAAQRSDGDKPEKISATNAKIDDWKKVNAAAILKMARANMMKILLYLFAFALGAYVSNLRWVSKKVDN